LIHEFVSDRVRHLEVGEPDDLYLGAALEDIPEESVGSASPGAMRKQSPCLDEHVVCRSEWLTRT
jgi:hypothetical protein